MERGRAGPVAQVFGQLVCCSATSAPPRKAEGATQQEPCWGAKMIRPMRWSSAPGNQMRGEDLEADKAAPAPTEWKLSCNSSDSEEKRGVSRSGDNVASAQPSMDAGEAVSDVQVKTNVGNISPGGGCRRTRAESAELTELLGAGSVESAAFSKFSPTTRRISAISARSLCSLRDQHIGPCRRQWFQSRVAHALGRAVNSSLFLIMSSSAVVTALFLPDLLSALQTPTNLPQNVVQLIVMCVFVFGFVCCLASDPDYPFSFFFWIDILGIVAMIFDIEWFLGEDATQPTVDRTDSVGDSIVYARAARASWAAARMGRMARMLRLLRMLQLPWVPGKGKQRQFAQIISIQLNNVLSTRVAFLCVGLIVILSALSLYRYPENDYSMASWVVLLSSDAAQVYTAPVGSADRKQAAVQLNVQLQEFRRFYMDIVSLYGPYEVCFRKNPGDTFECGQDSIEGVRFIPPFFRPRRLSSAFALEAPHARASFDLSLPFIIEAVVSIVTMVVFVATMGFFSMMVTARIHSLVITPLERMLALVRSRCVEIFEYTDRIQDPPRPSIRSQGERSERPEASARNEFLLLAQAVEKLGAVSSLVASRRMPEIGADMTDDQILVLNLEGHQIQEQEVAFAPTLTQSSSFSLSASLDMVSPAEDIVTSLRSDSFDALEIPEGQKPGITAYLLLASEAAAESGRFSKQTARSRVMHFAVAVANRYQPNPFHNFSHALDVTAGVLRTMAESGANLIFSADSQLWLLIAAVAHDLGHPGVNNQFLVETSHAYALRYNDRSPLENFHCASLFQLVQVPDNNIFRSLPNTVYKEARKAIVASILATDMAEHHSMLTELGLLLEVNSELLDRGFEDPGVVELLQEKGNLQLLANSFLHFSDTGNPMKPWPLCYKLAQLCLDEFFAQGDKEKAHGIPVQMLNDRDKVNRPNSQVGFIEFMILPLAEAMVSLFPALQYCTQNLGENTGRWTDLWEQGSAHPADEVEKFRARAQKVINRCFAAGARRRGS